MQALERIRKGCMADSNRIARPREGWSAPPGDEGRNDVGDQEGSTGDAKLFVVDAVKGQNLFILAALCRCGRNLLRRRSGRLLRLSGSLLFHCGLSVHALRKH